MFIYLFTAYRGPSSLNYEVIWGVIKALEIHVKNGLINHSQREQLVSELKEKYQRFFMTDETFRNKYPTDPDRAAAIQLLNENTAEYIPQL